MPSADLFLRLLEEKDLVSALVLQDARRQIQSTSPPPDAVYISLWLVQGHHITASQAERLLAAVAEKADAPALKPPVTKVVEPRRPVDQIGKPDLREERSPSQGGKVGVREEGTVSQAGKPDLRREQPKSRPAAAAGRNDLELTPLSKEVRIQPAANTSDAVTPAVVSPAAGKEKKNPAAGKIGGELESLDSAMKGPLDALIESEALGASEFDDPLAGPDLYPVSKKFTFRRFVKSLLRRAKSKTVRVEATDPQQVKLIVVSWLMALVILIGVLTALWFYLPQGSKELLQKAQEAVAAEDYSQAIGVYDEFLKRYPKVSQANDVRLLRCLAELRAAEKNATASGDWTPAFEVAQTQVKALPKEYSDPDDMQKKFGIALAKIGEGLAQQARGHLDAASVGRVQTVVDMLESAIPESNQPGKMLDEMKDMIKHGKQEVEGRRELDQTVATIRAAVLASDVEAAYAAYRDFTKSFPECTNDPRLTDAMKQVSAVQQKAVKSIPQSLAALHDERPSGLLAAMPLAVQPVKGELAAARGKRVFVVEQGTAYGLDAATGKVLWRRFVSLDPKFPAVTALSIAAPAGNDVVLCDPVRQELLRLRGGTGELLWRLPVKQPILAPPVPADKWLLLLTSDRRLVLIDQATGESPRYFQLPQAVRLPPVVDAARGLVFLAAEKSNVFVLDTDQCRQVMHVGYETGNVAAPPAVVGDFLLLPVNDSPGVATIRVFSISKDKEGDVLAPVQAIPVAGYIDTTPVALGEGAAVVTAQGSLFAFDRTEAGSKLPFQKVASNENGLNERTSHYAVSGGGTFWVVDQQLTRYVVRADEHRVAPQSTTDLGMRFVQAPVIEDGAMFQVLQKSGMPGVTVAAFDFEKNEAFWQTWLAAPLVAEPMLGVPSGKLTAVTASLGLFRGRPEDLKPSVKPWEPDRPLDSSRLIKPLDTLLQLPGEVFVMTCGADTKQILVFDPNEKDLRFQFRWLQSPREMAAGPVWFAGGLLTPCVSGQIFLLDREARGDLAKPLEPATQRSTHWEWQPPVAVDDKLAILSDGNRRLMAINISTDEKALTEVAAATTKTTLVSPLAVLGKAIFVVDSTDSLLSFELPNLTPGKTQVLGSRCVWGPQRVGKLVLLATAKNHLLAISEQQQVVWQAELSYGPLAGAPCSSGEEIYLSSRSGMVWRISAANGKELGKVEVGCPLGTGPLVVGPRLIVGGHEGSLLELNQPITPRNRADGP